MVVTEQFPVPLKKKGNHPVDSKGSSSILKKERKSLGNY